MSDQEQNFIRMRFNKNKVWVATGPDGKPDVQNGKVLIKYQLNQDHEYWIHEKSITPLPDDKTESGVASVKGTAPKVPKKKTPPPVETDDEPVPDNAVLIYTDGASSGNPGPSGIGVMLRFGDREKEISKFIGEATNNIAELEAIREGLLALRKKNIPVRVYTDSSYAFGVLTLGWKAQKNRALISDIKKLISKFKDIKFIKVKGHAGIPENERADKLATAAISYGIPPI
ncbi:MAG: ribonuclease HI [Desulfobacterales bacterium]|nr:ribonuclease HI [Desulfobacterales bacterium]